MDNKNLLPKMESDHGLFIFKLSLTSNMTADPLKVLVLFLRFGHDICRIEVPILS